MTPAEQRPVVARTPVVAEMVLQPVAEDVRAARAFTMTQLTPYVADDEQGEDFLAEAAIVISEFATNALDAGAVAIRLHLRIDASGVVISIIDDAAGQLRISVHDPLAVRGRGLHMVDRIARRWGVADDPAGKRAWAELDFPQ